MKYKYWIIENDHYIVEGTNDYKYAMEQIEGCYNLSLFVAKNEVTKEYVEKSLYNM